MKVFFFLILHHNPQISRGVRGGDAAVKWELLAFSLDACEVCLLCQSFLRIGFLSHWSRNLTMGSEKSHYGTARVFILCVKTPNGRGGGAGSEFWSLSSLWEHWLIVSACWYDNKWPEVGSECTRSCGGSLCIYYCHLWFITFNQRLKVWKFHIQYCTRNCTRNLFFSIYTNCFTVTYFWLSGQLLNSRVLKIKAIIWLVEPSSPIEFYGVTVSDLIIWS